MNQFTQQLNQGLGLAQNIYKIGQMNEERKYKQGLTGALGELRESGEITGDYDPRAIMEAEQVHYQHENKRKEFEDTRAFNTLWSTVGKIGPREALRMETSELAEMSGLPEETIYRLTPQLIETAAQDQKLTDAWEKIQMVESEKEFGEFQNGLKQSALQIQQGDKMEGLNNLQKLVNNTPNGFKIQATSEDTFNLYRDEGDNDSSPVLVKENMSTGELLDTVQNTKFQEYTAYRRAYQQEVAEHNKKWAQKPLEFFDDNGNPYRVRYMKGGQYPGAPQLIEMTGPNGRTVGKWAGNSEEDVFNQLYGSEQASRLFRDQAEAKRKVDIEMKRAEEGRKGEKHGWDREKHDDWRNNEAGGAGDVTPEDIYDKSIGIIKDLDINSVIKEDPNLLTAYQSSIMQAMSVGYNQVELSRDLSTLINMSPEQFEQRFPDIELSGWTEASKKKDMLKYIPQIIDASAQRKVAPQPAQTTPQEPPSTTAITIEDEAAAEDIARQFGGMGLEDFRRSFPNLSEQEARAYHQVAKEDYKLLQQSSPQKQPPNLPKGLGDHPAGVSARTPQGVAPKTAPTQGLNLMEGSAIEFIQDGLSSGKKVLEGQKTQADIRSAEKDYNIFQRNPVYKEKYPERWVEILGILNKDE